MKKYIKKNVSIDVVKQLHEKFNLSKLEASILARRNITSSNSLLYYLEDDLRFSHIPFLLKNMEDAVERILAAKEEGEKVLIFGDLVARGRVVGREYPIRHRQWFRVSELHREMSVRRSNTQCGSPKQWCVLLALLVVPIRAWVQ